VIVAVTSAFLVVGVFVGRWWFVAVPLAFWPVWYAVEHARGATGDLWWLGFLVVTALSVGLAALGVALRRSGFGHRDRLRNRERLRRSA
jgi:hypothetical protein